MKKIILLASVLLILSWDEGVGQSLSVTNIGSAGTHVAHSTVGSIDWSIGETLVELYNPNPASNLSLTQGFHQVFVSIISNSNDDIHIETSSAEVNIYPSPCNDWFKINCSLPIKVRLINLQGQTIFPFGQVSEVHELDSSQLASGLYILEISQANNHNSTLHKIQIIH